MDDFEIWIYCSKCDEVIESFNCKHYPTEHLSKDIVKLAFAHEHTEQNMEGGEPI